MALPSQNLVLSADCLQAVERYGKADLELLRLEDQLDFIIRCSRAICDHKVDLAQDYAKSPECDRSPQAIVQATEAYLRLIDRGKALDDEIAALKEKCSDARNKCSWLYMRLKAYPGLRAPRAPDHNATPDRVACLDGCGFMDKQTVIKRLNDLARTTMNVGAAVGALGAGVTFTTLFSATRGRLDLIAWASSCFVSVVFICAMYQNRTMAYRMATMALIYSPISEGIFRLFLLPTVGVVVPLVVGLGLLAVAIGLLQDPSQAIVSGSQTASNVAGYTTLGWIAILLLSMINRKWRVLSLFYCNEQHIPSPNDTAEKMGGQLKLYPSHILPPDSKWDFIPGGQKYAIYRKWRQDNSWGSPSQRAA